MSVIFQIFLLYSNLALVFFMVRSKMVLWFVAKNIFLLESYFVLCYAYFFTFRETWDTKIYKGNTLWYSLTYRKLNGLSPRNRSNIWKWSCYRGPDGLERRNVAALKICDRFSGHNYVWYKCCSSSWCVC